MFGGVIMALGAAGMIRNKIASDMESSRSFEISKLVPGEVYEIHNGLEHYYRTKEDGINVAVYQNCFGEHYAVRLGSTRAHDVYGAIMLGNDRYCEDEKGIDNTTIRVNPYHSYSTITSEIPLYFDKVNKRRLCEWNGIYFDADTSEPVRFVKRMRSDIDLRKIWVMNEVAKRNTGISIWQLRNEKDLRMPGINIYNEKHVDYVEFREQCKNALNLKCDYFSSPFVTYYKEAGEVWEDTTFSADEYARRRAAPNEYLPVI